MKRLWGYLKDILEFLYEHFVSNLLGGALGVILLIIVFLVEC